VGLAFSRDGSQLRQRVNTAGLGGLRKRDNAGLGEMNILALGGEFPNGLRGQFAVGAWSHQQLRTIGKELRCAALIGFNMRLIATDDPVV